MTPQDAGDVLAMAARADRRTVGAEDIKLWCAALTQAGVSRDEALAAVIEHTATRPDVYLTHGHVIEIVRRRRRNRLARSWTVEAAALAQVDPDDPAAVREALRSARTGMASETPRSDAKALPPGRYDDLDGQRDRNARGAAQVREVLAEHAESAPKQITAEPVDHSTQVWEAARLRAARERRAGVDVGDPEPIGKQVRRALRGRRGTNPNEER